MSPVGNNFGSAAAGQTPITATASQARIMGKDAGDFMALAEQIGTAVADGNARPVNWMAATTKVAPGGGLAPKGNEAPYQYQGADMFGLENPGAKIG